MTVYPKHIMLNAAASRPNASFSMSPLSGTSLWSGTGSVQSAQSANKKGRSCPYLKGVREDARLTKYPDPGGSQGKLFVNEQLALGLQGQG
jgi:hypothetical protein